MEYREIVYAVPVNVTGEDLSRNHAAGLPIMREWIVRCKDCYYFLRDATPHDEDCPHFCSHHGSDMDDDNGFCSWAREAE